MAGPPRIVPSAFTGVHGAAALRMDASTFDQMRPPNQRPGLFDSVINRLANPF